MQPYLPLLLSLEVGTALALVLGVHVAQVLIVAVYNCRRILVVAGIALSIGIGHE